MGFGSLLSYFNSTDEQGDFGEFKVKNKILRLGEKLGYFYLVRDVYIETKYFVQQIDHILINSNGIFVIETKGTNSLNKLRQPEADNIRCGIQHFSLESHVKYDFLKAFDDFSYRYIHEN